MAREYAPDDTAPKPSKREFAPEPTEFDTQVREVKEFGQGLALPVLGLAQSIPYEPIQRFATEKVKSIEETPEYVRPGGFGGARSLGKFIGSAGMYGGPTGKLIQSTAGLPLLPRLATRTGGGAGIGGATAAAIEETPDFERIGKEKKEAGQYGAAFGALLTPTLPGVTEFAGKLGNIVSKARGKPLEREIGVLRETTEEVGTEAERRIAQRKEAGEQRIYTQGQRREINLRDAAREFDFAAQKAKAESQSALRQIAPITNDVELGEKIRQTAVITEQGLKEARQKAADKLKTTYFNEAKANEKAGNFWAQSQTGKEFIKFLKDIQNPANAGKYTVDEIAAARDLELSLATRKVKGKAVPSEIDKIEKIIRETKEVQRMPIQEGAKALQQQYKSKLAQKLEDSVYGYVDEVGVLKEGFAPTGRVFRNVYREMSIPLNQYESPVGKVLTQQVEGLPGVFTADVTQIPASVFRSPQQIAILDAAGIGRNKLEPLAAEYTANRLSKFNSAEKINEFINSAEGAYLKEFPQLLSKTQQYAQTFASNEVKAGAKEAGAKALKTRAGEMADVRQRAEQELAKLTKDDRDFVNSSLANIRNANQESIARQSESYVKGLRSRGIITPQEESTYIAQIRQVQQTAKDKQAAITALKGVLPYAAAVGGSAVAGYSLNKILGGL